MNEYTLAEIEVGMKAVFHKTITKKMEDAFRVISGDENPLHKCELCKKVTLNAIMDSKTS